MSCANVFYVSNKFHARYRRVENAMNAFGARVMHASATCVFRFYEILLP